MSVILKVKLNKKSQHFLYNKTTQHVKLTNKVTKSTNFK